MTGRGNFLAKVTVVFALVLLLAPLARGGSVPQLINYNGTLTNATGNPVADGKYDVAFNIYDAATGGNVLWSEQWNGTTTQVIVAGGNFNVMLGAHNPLPAGFFAEHPVAFLGVTVGADSEMLPRQRITSVGYAFAAGNGIPKKGIIMWSGALDQVPEGWALCDGTNGTPDLRARFVVGAGGTYTAGAAGGEATHVLTAAEMPVHNHGVNDPGHRHQMITNGGTTSAGNFANVSGGSPDQWTQVATTGITIQNAGSGQPHNNLPPYYALAFIMKL